MNPWLSQTMVQALGWTLVHFLWQGLVIAALLAAGLRMFASRPAHYKYLAACLAMALMALAPLVTFRLVLSQPEPLPAITPISAKISPVRTSEIFTLDQPTRAANPGSQTVSLFERLNHLLPWLVLGWLAGVCALSCRLFLGWLQVRRLQRTATHPLPSPWPEKLAALALRLGVNRPIQLLQSALIEVPTVIGWLRPVILLPASCLTGLTPGQLEAIIAHELAHIRRHDYLINLLQSIIETLLFYHPAVWWVSRRIREERENCCDDLAVEACGDLVGYARALATLEELRPASAQLMLAAGGAPLLQRIRRLAGQPERSAGRASWPVAGITLFLVLGILAAGRMEHRATAAPQLTEETNTNGPPPLEVRTFHVDTKTFLHGLERGTGIPLINTGDGGGLGPEIQLAAYDTNTPAFVVTGNQSTTATAVALRAFFAANGVQLGANTANVVIFNEKKGTLTVRATSEDIKKIEAVVQILNNSPPSSGDNRQAATNQTQLATLIQDGKFLYEVGRYDEAAAKFKQALAIDPHNLPALQYLRLTSEKQIMMSRTNSIKLVAKSTGTTSSNESTNAPVTPTSRTVPAAGNLPNINIRAKFVEITTAPDDTNLLFTTNGPGAVVSFTGLLTGPQFHATIEALRQRNGTEVLPAPEITTGSGRQAQMQIGNMQTIVTLGQGTNAYNTTNMLFGETLDAIGTVSADKKSIDLRLIPSITEFLGYTYLPAVASTRADGRLNPLPHFRLRQTTANVTVWDGQTVVIGGLATVGGTNTANIVEKVPLLGDLPVVGGLFRSESTQKMEKKSILIFVTATLINPDGTRYHSDDEQKALWAVPPPQLPDSTNR